MDLRSIFQSINPYQNIIWCPEKHSKEEVASAKRKIAELISPVREYNEKMVANTNTILENAALNLEVFSYDCTRLVVAISCDFIYYHNYEIVFEEVFYLSGLLGEWNTPHPKPTLRIEETGPEPKCAENELVQFFVFSSDERRDHLIVGASCVSCNQRNVYYYPRENL